MELNDKTTLIILFLLLFSFSIGNAQEKKIRVKVPKKAKSERQVPIKTLETIQAPILGAPLNPSTSSHVSAYDVDDLTDELLHRKRIQYNHDSSGRPLIGQSVFGGFYGHRKPGDRLTVDWRWLMSDSVFIKMHPDRIDLNSSIFASIDDYISNSNKPLSQRKVLAPLYVKSFAPDVNGFHVDFEKLLESIFWKKAPDHWTHYGDISQSVLAQLPTLMPDSLVRLRMLETSDVSSVVMGPSTKYKIVYFFCADKGNQKDSFKRIASYVSSHEDKYYFIPISGVDKLSNVASYLKHQGYFEKAYVVNSPGTLIRTFAKMADMKQAKDVPTYFVLNKDNKVIATGNSDSDDFGKLDSIIDTSSVKFYKNETN